MLNVRAQPYLWYEGLLIIKVLKGTIKLRAWAEDTYMSIGDFVVLNSGRIHMLTAISQDNIVSVTYFNKTFCHEAYEGFDNCFILCNSVRHRCVDMNKYNVLGKKLDKLITEYARYMLNTNHTQFKEESKNLIRYLCYHFDYVTGGIGLERFNVPIIERNQLLYREVFKKQGTMSQATLKEISAFIGVNYSYFRSDIVNRFGIGFKWMKTTAVTERAAKMVISTDLNLMKIGMQSGFSDPKYMIKYFKIFYGCTPSQFRKRYKLQTDDGVINHSIIPFKQIMRYTLDK